MIIERISDPDDRREAHPISGIQRIGWIGIINAEGTALAYSTDSWREASKWTPAKVEVPLTRQKAIHIETSGEMVLIPLPENVRAFKSYGGLRFEVMTKLPDDTVKIQSKEDPSVTALARAKRILGDPYLWRRYNETEGTRIEYGVSHWELAPDQGEWYRADISVFLILPRRWGVRFSHHGTSRCISLPEDVRPTVHPHHVTFEYLERA